jgi:hypothetical protein
VNQFITVVIIDQTDQRRCPIYKHVHGLAYSTAPKVVAHTARQPTSSRKSQGVVVVVDPPAIRHVTVHVVDGDGGRYTKNGGGDGRLEEA